MPIRPVLKALRLEPLNDELFPHTSPHPKRHSKAASSTLWRMAVSFFLLLVNLDVLVFLAVLGIPMPNGLDGLGNLLGHYWIDSLASDIVWMDGIYVIIVSCS